MSNHIVAIGVSKHQSAYNDLAFAHRDAEEFYGLFLNNVSDIGYQRLLINSDATLGHIRSALGARLQESVKDGDSFFFFYSGHGATAPAEGNTVNAHYLLPFDATDDIPNSCISVLYLKEVFDSLSSRANVVMVDTCFSGAMHNSKNSKGVDTGRIKSGKTLKSLIKTVSGNGNVTFTACTEDEVAIEDGANRHGLFTHFLLKEIQRSRKGDKFSIADIATPIQEAVLGRAKAQYSMVQTPTFSGHLEGPIYLPVFTKPESKSTGASVIPEIAELEQTVFPTTQFQFDEADLEKTIKDAINLVVQADTNQIAFIAYERACWDALQAIKEQWEVVYEAVGSDIKKLPWAVGEMERAAFELHLLSAVTAAFGSEKEMKLLGDCAAEIIKFGEGRSGLVALIAVPEVVLAELVYIVGVSALGRERIWPLGTLLKTPVFDERSGDGNMNMLLHYNHIYYSDSLGRASTKVNEHIRKFLDSSKWLLQLSPRLSGRTQDAQLQVNFLLCMIAAQYHDHLWPDFARFNPEHVRSLAGKIKHDIEYQKQMVGLLGLKTTSEVLPAITEHLQMLHSRGLDNYWWSSIQPGFFVTKAPETASAP